MKDIRIASVTCNAPVGKTRQNIYRMAAWIEAAKKQNATLICFPEMNVTGYTTTADIRKVAEPVPGPATRELSVLAADEQMVILAGLAETDKKGRIFASHLVVRPDGDIGVYRKLHIAPPEKPMFAPGNAIPLFDVQGVRFGIQLCYDAHFPELSTHMAKNGAELIFLPHASPRGTPEEKYRSWQRHLPARAYDNSLFVMACNQVGDNGKGLHFPGVTMLLGPSGNIINKTISAGECLMVAELKAAELFRVRNNKMHFFLPNRRPELFVNSDTESL